MNLIAIANLSGSECDSDMAVTANEATMEFFAKAQRQDVSVDAATTISSVNETEVWQAEEIVAVLLMIILSPFILLGNALVIAAVVKYRRLQTTTNYFLVSLAVADICTGIFVPAFVIGEIFKTYISDSFWCLGPHCLLMTVCGASVLCLAAIAFDRYLALTRTLEYQHIMTAPKMIVYTIVSWIFSALISWSPLMGFYTPVSLPGIKCSFRLIRKEALILLLVMIFSPAYLIIFFCYTRIFLIARRHVSAIAALHMSALDQLEMNVLVKDTKYAKTLGIVIGLFVVCWIPYQLCILTQIISDIIVTDWVRSYLALLSYCNSGLNPWIYTFRNKDFKRAFTELLFSCFPCCLKKMKQKHNSKRQLEACGLPRTPSNSVSFEPRFLSPSRSDESPRSLKKHSINATTTSDSGLDCLEKKRCTKTLQLTSSDSKYAVLERGSVENLEARSAAQLLLLHRRCSIFLTEFEGRGEREMMSRDKIDEEGDLGKVTKQLDGQGHVLGKTIKEVRTHSLSGVNH